ncbi:ImmA/IrrE family metallo-endopeptidase [Paenibacillus chibensis]|uniref:ImmA/IrrE family metallo-endopeptidase n=1 Tax=Paenibacillus chibensis TaxID=59846 RepID=A0ABU6PWS1_9BACL|nr:ImmA/IrrE family metallo-endopeptidase [Paenibacillus chibensis]
MINDLLNEAAAAGVEVRTHVFGSSRLKGLYIDNVITLNSKALTSLSETVCILAEELGHHYTGYGNILNLRDIRSRKQEKRARNWGYERLVTLFGFVQAFESGARNRFEIAEFLGVTETYIDESIKHYQEKYGLYTTIENYIIYFEPLRIGKLFES